MSWIKTAKRINKFNPKAVSLLVDALLKLLPIVTRIGQPQSNSQSNISGELN